MACPIFLIFSNILPALFLFSDYVPNAPDALMTDNALDAPPFPYIVV